MIIRETIWLPEVEEKIIVKHQVWPEEVEDVLQSQPYIRFMELGHTPGEDLYGAFGQTMSGRYLTIYFLLKPPTTALIVTSRDMKPKERKTYGKRRK